MNKIRVKLRELKDRRELVSNVDLSARVDEIIRMVDEAEEKYNQELAEARYSVDTLGAILRGKER